MSRPRPSHAGFCPKAGYAGLDRGLAPALAEYFVARRRRARPATVGDFGAGRGWYSAYLNKVEGLAAAPYDYGARPGTAVRPFDISRPLNGTVPVFDAVLCLEVGEHVPARFGDVIFDNIATHARDAALSTRQTGSNRTARALRTDPCDSYVRAATRHGRRPRWKIPAPKIPVPWVGYTK